MKNLKADISLIRNLLILLVLVVFLILMKLLAGILLPLVLALLLCIIFLPLVLFLEKRHFPTGLITAVISIITFGALLSAGNVFIATINEIIERQNYFVSQFSHKFSAIIGALNSLPFINFDASTIYKGLENVINRDFLTSALGGLFRGARHFGSSFFMFTLYFMFLLPGLTRYKTYLRYVGNDKDSVLENYEIIQKNISAYMLIKMILSAVTGTVVWLVCLFTGLDFAFFWGFLTMILNFIPSIGSIIATILPLIFGIILFDSYEKMLLLTILLTANQFLIGNILDPRIMGNRLRLNTVTVLFGLVFWGVIWGIPGMLLSVPLTVILKLIMEKSSSWSVFARVMGYPDKEGHPNSPFRNEGPQA